MSRDLTTAPREAANPLPRPRLPASLLRAVEHGETAEWAVPSAAECKALAASLPAAIDQAEGYLGPATEPVMARALAGIAVSCRPQSGDSPAAWAMRTAEYMRLLGHFPSDIWRDACDEWATTPDVGRWYPTTAELHALMQARLVKRQRVAARLRRMAEIAAQPAEQWVEPTVEEKAAVSAIVSEATRKLTAITREMMP